MNETVKRTVLAYNTFLPNDPTREFKAWMEDPQNMFVSSVYLFNAQNMYERWQYDIIDGQREDGNSPNVTPGAFYDAYNSPWWGGCLLWVPWHWYQYYGDVSLLKESYTAMKRYVDYLQKISLYGIQDWGLMDWQPVEETPRPIINTPAYYFYADIVAKTALLTGNNEDFAQYSKLAEVIRNNFNNHYLDKSTGIYGSAPNMFLNGFYEWKSRINNYRGRTVDHEIWWKGNRVCTQAGQVLPLALGMVPENSRFVVEESLLREIKAHNNRLSTGFVSTPYLLQIIGDLDPETGWEMTTAQDYPSWYSMTAGSDNDLMNEDWAGGNAFMPSLGGNIAGWNYQSLAGILPDSSAPGFKKIIIKPNVVGDLHWVEGWYESVHGKIISNWRKEGNKLLLNITIPPNTMATVYIPIFKINIPDRKAILESGRPAEESTGIKYLRTDKKFMIYETGSGNYIFSTELK
jgi:alpha-L-rhamnosidase